MLGDDKKKGNFAQSLGVGNQPKITIEDNVNTTANNSLRYSNLISHSHQSGSLPSTGIHCPVYQDEGVYKCEICSNLRMVCPRNRTNTTSKQRRDINIQNKQYINKQTQNLNNISTQDVIRINLKQNQQIRGGSGLIKNQNSDRLSINYHNSIPVIEQGTQNFVYRPSSSGGIRPMEYNGNIKIKPGTPLTPAFVPSSNSQTRIYQQSSNNARYIEQIIYVPVIHNIIKPQFINPESKFQHSTNFKYQQRTPQQNKTKVSQPLTSPIRVEQYDDRVMTPTNLRNLANSIIR